MHPESGKLNHKKNVLCTTSVITLIGCWRFTRMLTQNGVVTVVNNETTPLKPYSLLVEFTKATESWISETRCVQIAAKCDVFNAVL